MFNCQATTQGTVWYQQLNCKKFQHQTINLQTITKAVELMYTNANRNTNVKWYKRNLILTQAMYTKCYVRIRCNDNLFGGLFYQVKLFGYSPNGGFQKRLEWWWRWGRLAVVVVVAVAATDSTWIQNPSIFYANLHMSTSHTLQQVFTQDGSRFSHCIQYSN